MVTALLKYYKTFTIYLRGFNDTVYVLPITVNMPTKLQCLDVPILDDQECENAYPGMITRRMMCAGHLEGGRDACNVSFKPTELMDLIESVVL